jgi:hypothetical protein
MVRRQQRVVDHRHVWREWSRKRLGRIQCRCQYRRRPHGNVDDWGSRIHGLAGGTGSSGATAAATPITDAAATTTDAAATTTDAAATTTAPLL